MRASLASMRASLASREERDNMINILIYAISWFANLLVTLLLVRALLSWFANNPYSMLGKIYMVLVRLTEPIVMPCRRLLSRFNTGMFDFSVLLAMLLIELVANLLIRLIIFVI